MGRGRAPCCEKVGLNKGPWSAEEDMRLMAFIHKYGHGNWRSLPKLAGLLRCGKSCRLRWINYLRPDIKRGNFTDEEEDTIMRLHASMGNKWSKIASCLPGRTDNEIKNVWNTHLKKRVASKGGKSNRDASCTSSSSSSCCTSLQNSSSGQREQVKLSSSSTETIEIPAEPADVDMWSILLDDDEDDVEQKEVEDPEDSNNAAPRAVAQVGANISVAFSSVCSSPPSSSSQVFAMDGNAREPQGQDVNGGGRSLVMLDVDIEPEFWSIVGDCGASSPAGTAREFGRVNPIAVTEEEGGEGSSGSDGGWLVYLEKELGLFGSGHGDHDHDDLICALDVELEGDPVTNYFKKSPCF